MIEIRQDDDGKLAAYHAGERLVAEIRIRASHAALFVPLRHIRFASGGAEEPPHRKVPKKLSDFLVDEESR